MSVCTYKNINGEIACELVTVELLEGQLGGGWKLSEEELKEDYVPITQEDADTNNSGKLSADEIRQAAKNAGIDGWENKRIKTLEAELWPIQKQI